MSPDTFKFLIVADKSAEFAPALAFAAHRCKAINAGLVILAVVDSVSDQSHWVTVGEEMRAEALEAAEAMGERMASEVRAETGVEAEVLIREGDLRTELKRVIDHDRGIRLLVLGAGSGREGPGPLVALAGKGHSFGVRPVPMVIVPGSLSKDEARELASPFVAPAE
jgi:hypothetical protein